MNNQIAEILEICKKEGEYQGTVNDLELKELKKLDKKGNINLIVENSGLGSTENFVQLMLKNNQSY